MGMKLTDHRIDEIFAHISRTSEMKEGELDEEQFGNALGYLEDINVEMSLMSLGIGKDLLI